MATEDSGDGGTDAGAVIEGRGGSVSFKTAVATFIGQQGTFISLHNGDPGTTGANAIGVARQQTTWGAPAADGVRQKITGSKVSFTGVPAGNITHFGVWKTVGGADFQYGSPLTPTATLNATGNVDVTPAHTYDVT